MNARDNKIYLINDHRSNRKIYFTITLLSIEN